jgi:hypothetical protein
VPQRERERKNEKRREERRVAWALSLRSAVLPVPLRAAQGAIKLDMRYEPSDKPKKSAGTLHVMVKEGAGLTTKEPYVKLYVLLVCSSAPLSLYRVLFFV